MGFFHSAYFAYGIEIPPTDEDTLDRGIPGGTEVGHLHAGSYDRDKTFLVTKCTEADLGGYETVRPQDTTSDEYETWNTQLAAAAKALGVTPVDDPGWLVIPDMS
ncbi:hypothetical protein [Streptomyces sp. NPDC055243]|uniref:hypothetical protein n=1 Tax=Streptomyces sp. NPDC055243 TaxID=3365720 RepID=UPI0037CCFBE9